METLAYHEHLHDCKSPPGLRWACLEPMPISTFLPSSGIIVAAVIILIGFARQYVVEMWLMRKPRLYRKTYEQLSPRNQRTLVNHHISLFTKVFLLLFGVYPFARITQGTNFDVPLHKGSTMTMGDMLFISSEIYTGMYLMELCYRQGISPITWVHHTCTVLMAQIAGLLTWQTEWGRNSDSAIELVLCFTWGVFDILSEATPHLTMIFYRLYPAAHHRLFLLFRGAFATTLLATLLETAIIMWIYGSMFNRWSLSLKVLTPMFHALFTVAQAWSTWCLWKLGIRQRRLMSGEHVEIAGARPEAGKGAVAGEGKGTQG